jgi:hypothetical protein
MVDMEELFHWLILMSGYNVVMKPTRIGFVMYMKVIHTTETHADFRLAEMACQINYHQIGGVCPICKEEGEAHCGHLTFGAAI